MSDFIRNFERPFSGRASQCSLYSVEKSIYRLPRSLLAVVLRSSRGESILQRDVEKRDVDIPRDRESDSGGETARIKKKRGNWAVGERDTRVRNLAACVNLCTCAL